MTRRLFPGLLLLVLLTAAFLRLTAVDWDDYQHYHPDERYILWVATTIEWPSHLLTIFDPTQSTLNPYYWPPHAVSDGIVVPQDQPRRFAYGHVPLYVGVLATRMAEQVGLLVGHLLPEDWLLTRDILNMANRPEFFHMAAVTRALTGLVDVGTVLMLFFLGQRLYGTAVGLLAATFLALNVMHIQLAHFFAVDPYVTFFVVTAVLLMVLAVQTQRTNPSPNSRWAAIYLVMATMRVGLAVGSKFAAILLLLPLALTVWLDDQRPRWERLWRLLAAGSLALVIFALTNPFAILDVTCEALTPPIRVAGVQIPALNWQSCFLENMAIQGGMVSGDNEQAFTRQYINTTPYLYPIEMQLRWGMGPLLGIVAFAGLLWAVILSIYNLRLPLVTYSISRQTTAVEHLLVLAWVIPFFISMAGLHVKFMRYLQPVIPFLLLYGAALLISWAKRPWQRVVVGLIVLVTALYAFSFVNLYREPHPWITASNWIYAHAAPGDLILSEQWDESLPTSLPAGSRNQYQLAELNWLVGIRQNDNEAKLAANLALLAEADYLIIASNRVYGVVPRLPERYPISGQYHQLLFDGRLGYEVAYVDGRFPNLAAFHLKHDTFGWPRLRPPTAVAAYLESLPGPNWGRADESFTVYDQPLVIIFENRERLTTDEMAAFFITK